MSTGRLRLNVGNLDNVQEGFAPLPEGVYKMQVQSIDMVTSKQGNDMAKVTLVVTDPQDHIGRKGFCNLVIVPDAMWKLKQFCKAAGLTWDETGVDMGQALGKELSVKVTQEQYTNNEGVTRITNRFDEFVQ